MSVEVCRKLLMLHCFHLCIVRRYSNYNAKYYILDANLSNLFTILHYLKLKVSLHLYAVVNVVYVTIMLLNLFFSAVKQHSVIIIHLFCNG
jgi:hypothetical protein